MAQFLFNKFPLNSLKDKVVVLTGGSSGIGAATVLTLFNTGAKVVFGDVSVLQADSVVESLKSNTKGGEVHFLETDATSEEDTYALFRKAFDTYGRVDHAVACAGIFERGKWFDPDLNVDTLKNKLIDTEARKTFDTNLWGSLVFARIAHVFLREGRNDAAGDKSLTILASVNSFRESPQLYMYQVGKHGLLGLLRSTRSPLHTRDGIRVNAVCPGVTESGMTASLIGGFKENGLHWQPSDAVAQLIAALMAAGPVNTASDGSPSTMANSGITGKAFYIEGSKAWEYEEGLERTMPDWLGEEGTKMMRTNRDAVMKGALLKK